MRTPFTALKMAAFAPIASANVAMEVAAKAGDRSNSLKA
jgi:hypothetical protein